MASAVIYALQTVSGNQPKISRIIEEAGQDPTTVGLLGVPCQVAADGGIQVWDGATVTQGIAGFTKEAFSDLATTGVPKTQSFGSVPYESDAVNIARGAPFNDGRIGFEASVSDSVFFGQVGPSQTTAATDVGVQYGMTQDTDNHWYVDKTKTAGGSVVVVVVALDYNDTVRGVHFQVLPAAQQATA